MQLHNYTHKKFRTDITRFSQSIWQALNLPTAGSGEQNNNDSKHENILNTMNIDKSIRIGNADAGYVVQFVVVST